VGGDEVTTVGGERLGKRNWEYLSIRETLGGAHDKGVGLFDLEKKGRS